MQHVQEGCECVAGYIANLGLVHESFIEQIRRVLLFRIFFAILLAIGIGIILVLLRCGAWNVESHLDQLIGTYCSLPTAGLCASSRLPLGSSGFCPRQCKFNCHLILSRQVRIGNLRVGYLEGWSVLHVEGQFRFGEFCFTPVPSSEGVFAVFDVDAVPDFESLGQALEVLVGVSISILSLMSSMGVQQTSWSNPSS